MFPTVPDPFLDELARTEGGPDALALLVRDQDTRRLLLLRAVLDAAESADPSACDPGSGSRLRDDWAMLTEADRTPTPTGGRGVRGVRDEGTPSAVRGVREEGAPSAVRDARGVPGIRDEGTPSAVRGDREEGAPSPVRDARGDRDEGTPSAEDAAGTRPTPARVRLFHPLVGPWARSCLRGLDGGAGTPAGRRALRRDLAHFSAVAAVAAAAAGLPFSTRLTARAGVLTLPSLGALHTAASGDVPVDVTHRKGTLTVRQPDAPVIRVHLEHGTGAWSGAPAWTPAHALPGLTPGAPPMPLDDLDPYREPPYRSHRGSLSGVATLDDAERKRWLQSWSGTAAALRSGGAHRLTEAAVLLRCLVPLEMPPDIGTGRGSCSATRGEAFGALLSSTPPDPVTFAATLVHELQHTKLAALGDLLTLHRAGPEARYFAPWRPDPRPYDGLLQGTYSHLALAAFHQRRALAAGPAEREWAWAQHARYHAQVGAALPALVGSPDLTVPGRRFVDELAATYEKLADHPAPRDHTARARAYVKSARALWTQRHAPALPRPKE